MYHCQFVISDYRYESWQKQFLQWFVEILAHMSGNTATGQGCTVGRNKVVGGH